MFDINYSLSETIFTDCHSMCPLTEWRALLATSIGAKFNRLND